MKVLIPLFSPPTGTWGSLTRVMALARHFVKMGDSAAFCASGFVHETIVEKGFTCFRMPETAMLGLPRFLSKLFLKNSQRMTPPVKEGKSLGNIWLLYFFCGLAKKKYLLRLVKQELAAVRAFKPDIIVTEMDPGAYLVSYLKKIPLVTTFAKIALQGLGGFFWRRVKKSMNHVLRQYSINDEVDPQDIAFHKNTLKLIPSIPELDTTDPGREDVCYTGNLLEPVREAKEPFVPVRGIKYVFCYLGTGSISLKTVVRVLPQVFKKNTDFICYAASQSIVKEYEIENVRFVRYIQAEQILPHCALVICHGGLNTITQSLETGVPLLVFPGPIFERRFNAEGVARIGAGFLGELSDFNPEWIGARLNDLDSLKDALARARQSFQRYRGAETAFERIRGWLQKRLTKKSREL